MVTNMARKAWWEYILDAENETPELELDASRSITDSWRSKLGIWDTEYHGFGYSEKREELRRSQNQLARTANVLRNADEGEAEKTIYIDWAKQDGTSINNPGTNTIVLSPDTLAKEGVSQPVALDAMTGYTLLASTLKRTMSKQAYNEAQEDCSWQAKITRPLWQAVETAIARADVLKNWEGFLGYFIRHAEVFTQGGDKAAIEACIKVQRPNAQVAAAAIAWNLLNPGNEVVLPDAYKDAVADAMKELGTTGSKVKRYEVCRAATTALLNKLPMEEPPPEPEPEAGGEACDEGKPEEGDSKPGTGEDKSEGDSGDDSEPDKTEDKTKDKEETSEESESTPEPESKEHEPEPESEPEPGDEPPTEESETEPHDGDSKDEEPEAEPESREDDKEPESDTEPEPEDKEGEGEESDESGSEPESGSERERDASDGEPTDSEAEPAHDGKVIPKLVDPTLFGEVVPNTTVGDEDLPDAVKVTDDETPETPAVPDGLCELQSTVVALGKTNDGRRYNYMVREMRGQIAAIRAALQFRNNCQGLMQRGLKSGGLDVGSLYKLAINERGRTPSIWERREIVNQPDIAVGLLVDESGSMCDKAKKAAQVTVALTEALRSIKGIQVMVLGHSGETHGACRYGNCGELDWGDQSHTHARQLHMYEYLTLKHDNPFAVAYTTARSQNYDGYAMEYAAKKLGTEYAAPIKLLFVISDGEPCASYYSGEPSMQHMNNVCQWAKEVMGVDTFGIGVCNAYTECEGELMYGHGKSVVLRDVTSSLNILTSFLRQVAAAAA